MARDAEPGGGSTYTPGDLIKLAKPRTRGADAPLRNVTLQASAEAAPHLERLARDVPEARWIVVVDGDLDAFARGIFDIIATRTDRILHYSRNGIASDADINLNGFRLFELSPDSPAEARFMASLPADVVVVSPRDGESILPRVERWRHLARFVFSQAASASS